MSAHSVGPVCNDNSLWLYKFLICVHLSFQKQYEFIFRRKQWGEHWDALHRIHFWVQVNTFSLFKINNINSLLNVIIHMVPTPTENPRKLQIVHVTVT